jgi:H+ antiporter protein
MFEVLADRTYRQLFIAQALALVGTGLLTVALGLLAYELAGAEAGAVLGTALAIKMIAYVGVSPIVGGLADRLPRRPFLVSMDLVRASIALLLPFVTEVWQIYLLIFLLQSASAGFTPTFQATIPDILPDERDYTRALSLSRLAYDMESLLSPALAGVLLTIISFHWLFGGTFLGFLVSAALVLSVRLPSPKAAVRDSGFPARTTRGLRIYLATPRLRGLLALNLSVAAAGAMVIVNTVVIVKAMLDGSDKDVAIALAFFGGGSMLAALLLPRLLDRTGDRPVMLTAAVALGALLLIFPQFTDDAPEVYWPALLSVWALLGFGYSSILVPTGRLLRRSAHPGDRPAVYAAQFSLSHACWLLTYPLAGWLGLAAGIPTTLIVLGLITLIGGAFAALTWPAHDPEVLPHDHPGLPAAHPHLAASGRNGRHAHAYVIDELHPAWPAARI